MEYTVVRQQPSTVAISSGLRMSLCLTASELGRCFLLLVSATSSVLLAPPMANKIERPIGENAATALFLSGFVVSASEWAQRCWYHYRSHGGRCPYGPPLSDF